MGQPIYKQIENYLKELIKSGELNEGSLLPSENQLVEMFNVTRMTVRSALNNLVAEGYIVKKKGVGSVVISTKIFDDIGRVSGFSKEMKEKGYDIDTIVYELAIIEAEDEISQKFNFETGISMWKVIRVRVANGQKVSCMITYMPVSLFTDLTMKHCQGSLYDYIENEKKYKIANSERSVEAIIATKELKKYLDLDYYGPILHIEQISRLDSGQIFEYSHTYHYNYKLTLNAMRH